MPRHYDRSTVCALPDCSRPVAAAFSPPLRWGQRPLYFCWAHAAAWRAATVADRERVVRAVQATRPPANRQPTNHQ